MFGSFKKSWQLTKATFKIINKDKKLLLFPVFSAIFSALFVLALIIPSLFFNNSLSFIFIFFLYFGLSFIATFFNVGVVYQVKNIIEGKKVNIKETMSFAFSKFKAVFIWSIISATVGLILRLIDALAEKVGGIGETLIKLSTSIIGGMWGFVTIFVVPIIVYKDISPAKAIAESSEKIKKKWGENLVRNIGFGVAEFIFIMLGVFALILGLVILSPLGFTVTTIYISLLAIYFVFVIMYFNVANAVFNTTLYVYSETGKMPLDFSEETAENLFSKKK